MTPHADLAQRADDAIRTVLRAVTYAPTTVVASPPGAGKCLIGSSRVFNPVTGSLRSIEAIVGDGESGGSASVLAIDERYRTQVADVSHFVRNGERDVFTLTTRLGRQLTATGNHPLLTLGGWVPLEELAAGSVVALPRSLPFFGSATLPEEEIVLIAVMIGDGHMNYTHFKFAAASGRS